MADVRKDLREESSFGISYLGSHILAGFTLDKGGGLAQL
jgi:hypothetical protein